jgi:hypothetical protein
MTWNTHAQRALSALAVAGTLAAGAWLGTAAAHADPFDQRDFPCMEDEVLGYAPQFGPDRVGCINVQGMIAEAVAEYN